MKRIQLTRNQHAKVSDAWYDHLRQWKWYAQRCKNGYYAARTARIFVNGTWKRVQIKMHRYLLGLMHGDTRQGDHANLDTLDNQIPNLRIKSNQGNCHNRGKYGRLTGKGTSSGLIGVVRREGLKPFRAWVHLTLPGGESKRVFDKSFITEKEAGQARDREALRYFGTDIQLNYPDELKHRLAELAAESR